MRKFLLLLALIASPAFAEDDVIAKARADLEALKAANLANEQAVIANNDKLIKKYKQDIAPNRPGPMLRTYVYRGHYIGSTTVCIQGKCF